MGCNKSSPFNPLSPKNLANGENFRPIQLNSFISQKFGPITDFFNIQRALGSLDQCTMYYAIEKGTGLGYSVKEVCKTQAFDSRQIQSEVQILSELDHPNILKLLETIETPRSFYVVYEYISGGTLKDKIKKIGDEVTVARYMFDALLALNYLHKHGYVHCDLNTKNIMISDESEDSISKIIGFTHARKEQSSIEGLEHVDPCYTSPELLTLGTLTTQTDMWSLGIILYYLLVGKLPFLCRNIDGILNEISSCQLDYININYQSLSVAAKDLISKMLERNVDTRITAEGALSHIWIQQAKKSYPINYNTLNKLKNFRIRSNLVKCFLIYYIFKTNLRENEIVRCFKEIDVNSDGTVSKEELIFTFAQNGINVDNDIDAIMSNIDLDQSGLIDYTELKLVLTDWDKEIKKKKIATLFETQNGLLDLKQLTTGLENVLPSEWKDFCNKVKPENNMISLSSLKAFIKSHLV